jgi:hypothetical protein
MNYIISITNSESNTCSYVLNDAIYEVNYNHLKTVDTNGVGHIFISREILTSQPLLKELHSFIVMDNGIPCTVVFSVELAEDSEPVELFTGLIKESIFNIEKNTRNYASEGEKILVESLNLGVAI